jgi:hypothetical protein
VLHHQVGLKMIFKYRNMLQVVNLLRFEILNSANMTVTVLWVAAPCSLVVHRPDGGGSKHL